MYPDPKRVRKHRHMVSLDCYEEAIIESFSNYQGEPFSTVLRQLAIRHAEEILEERSRNSIAPRQP